MGKIISVCNQKGGVGKTTTCVNLAAGLGVLERKVLVIDTDPQANATISFGFTSKKLNNPVLGFMNFVSIIKNNLIHTEAPNVDLLPYFEDVDFFNGGIENSRFKKALEEVSSLYDFIIIDCVPFFKTKNLEILVSSHSVIIPVQCDYYALEGLHTFLKTIRYVQKNLNKNLYLEGMLLTMFDSRLNLSKKVMAFMQSHFKEIVFKTIINRNSKITQAPSFGKSIFQYEITSVGANDYLQFANEIIKKNIVLETSKEIPTILEEEERVFNKKILSKSLNAQNKIKKNTPKIIKKLIGFDKKEENIFSSDDFSHLIGLNKHQVKNKLGLSENKISSNIWMYAKKKENSLLKKKYLYLYFSNNITTHYRIKRFKSFISYF